MEAGPLLRQALSPANLLTAWNRVAANRGMAGVDGETIDGIAPQVHGVLDEIAAGVWAGSYRPAALHRVWMARPGRSPRGLAVPTVRDRILQTAVTLALTPPVEAELEDQMLQPLCPHCRHAMLWQGKPPPTATEAFWVF